MRPILLLILLISTYTAYMPTAHAVQTTAPQFALPGENKTIKLSNYKGRVVYVDFWASWCEPCRRSFSWMEKLHTRYGEENFSIIAINLDESRDAAKEFLKKFPVSFEIAYDSDGKTAQSYNLKAMPSSFIINQQGQLVQRTTGFHGKDKELLEKQIQQLLDNKFIARK